MGWVKLTAWIHKRKFPPALGCRSEGRDGGGLWPRPAASRCFSAMVTSCEGTGGGALSWSWLGHPESPNSWRKYVALNNCPSSLPSSVKLSKSFPRMWVYPLRSVLSPRFYVFWPNNFRSLWPQSKPKLEDKCKCFAHCPLRGWTSISRKPSGS